MLHSFDEKLFDLLEKYMGMEVAPRYTLLTAKLFTLLTLLTWFTLLTRFTLLTLFILLKLCLFVPLLLVFLHPWFSLFAPLLFVPPFLSSTVACQHSNDTYANLPTTILPLSGLAQLSIENICCWMTWCLCLIDDVWDFGLQARNIWNHQSLKTLTKA